jgi:hypothetical protein
MLKMAVVKMALLFLKIMLPLLKMALLFLKMPVLEDETRGQIP